MRIEPIIWKFTAAAPELHCCVCNKPANHLAIIDNFKIPVCPDCGLLGETELLRRATEEVTK